MIYWYLIVCSIDAAGTVDVCLPMQAMASERQCQFVATQYRSLSTYARTRCFALRRVPT